MARFHICAWSKTGLGGDPLGGDEDSKPGKNPDGEILRKTCKKKKEKKETHKTEQKIGDQGEKSMRILR